jgi:N-glycosidase YbiA
MTIYFFTAGNENAYLSNFAPYGVEIEGQWYPTVEHFYQASKFLEPALSEQIRAARTPKDAKRRSRSQTEAVRPDWEDVKEEIMLTALRAKFQRHDDIRARLLATGTEELVENSRRDFYWGCGADGSGQNRLGRLLMQVRQELSL